MKPVVREEETAVSTKGYDDSVLVPRSSRTQQAATLAGVLVPFLGLIAAVGLSFGWGITWTEVSVLLVMYAATGLGVTVGYHRLFCTSIF